MYITETKVDSILFGSVFSIPFFDVNYQPQKWFHYEFKKHILQMLNLLLFA